MCVPQSLHAAEINTLQFLEKVLCQNCGICRNPPETEGRHSTLKFWKPKFRLETLEVSKHLKLNFSFIKTLSVHRTLFTSFWDSPSFRVGRRTPEGEFVRFEFWPSSSFRSAGLSVVAVGLATEKFWLRTSELAEYSEFPSRLSGLW